MALALLIASLLAATVQGIPQISPQIKSIVIDIYNALSGVLKSNVTTTLNPATILAALSGVIAALKSDPNLPQDKLALVAALESAAAAALAADQLAQKQVDPSQLHPITPL